MQFDVASVTPATPLPPPEPVSPAVDLLRQILDVQRQMLAQSQAAMAAQDPVARWRVVAERWRKDFPNLPEACRRVVPALERAFGAMIAALVDELEQQGDEALDSDFSIQDFIDRHGMRLGQMGHIINLIAPLAEAASDNESPSQ
jgi:hypothetical protein